jgi:hypothetical protein
MFQKFFLLLIISFFVACSAPSPLSINAPNSLFMRQEQSLQLTASSATSVQWSVVPANIGIFSTLGSRASFVAPNIILQPQTVVITVRSALYLNQTASVTVYLQPESISDSLKIFLPEVRSVPANARVRLAASDPDVLWAVLEGDTRGVIGATGEFIAPAVVPYPATVTIRATSKSNPNSFAQIQLGIVGNTGITGVITLPTKLIQPPKLHLQAALEPRVVRRAKYLPKII